MITYFEELGIILTIGIAFPLIWLGITLLILICIKKKRDSTQSILAIITVILLTLQTGFSYYLYIGLSIFDELSSTSSDFPSYVIFLTFLGPNILYFLVFLNSKIIRSFESQKRP